MRRSRQAINAPSQLALLQSSSPRSIASTAFALEEVFPAYVWVLKREVLWLPLFGWGLATLAPIAIDRKTGIAALRQILRTGSARLRNGLGVIIFPEGTRVRLGERRR